MFSDDLHMTLHILREPLSTQCSAGVWLSSMESPKRTPLRQVRVRGAIEVTGTSTPAEVQTLLRKSWGEQTV